MVGTADNKIDPGYFIEFNLSSLAANGYSTGTIVIGSLEGTETAALTLPNGTVEAVGGIGSTGLSAPIPFSFSIADPFLYLGAEPGSEVVGVGLDVAPEPGTLALVCTAAITGLVFLSRRLFG